MGGNGWPGKWIRLARQMDTVGLKYRQPGNCFVWIENYAQAQKLLEEQLQTNWAELLNGFAEKLNPIHESLLVKYPTDYYWTVYQSEWACARGVGHGRGVRRGRYCETFNAAMGAAMGAPGNAQLFQRRGAALLGPKSKPIGRHSGVFRRDG